MFCSNIHTGVRGGTMLSELPAVLGVYIPMFKQCLKLLGSGTSLKHLFLPFDSFFVIWPGLKTCCWRDNAVPPDMTRLSRWAGKGPEQDSWQLIYHHQINSLMPHVGCGCSASSPWEHSTPVTQGKASWWCLPAAAPWELHSSDLCLLFLP